MWRGNYERWYPIPALSGVRVGLEGLQNTERRLTLGLRGEEFVQAPRELVFFSPLAHFSASAGIVRESSYSHAFWEVAHSELVTTYRQQTEVTLPDTEIRHFVVLTSQARVDILALHEPTVMQPEPEAAPALAPTSATTAAGAPEEKGTNDPLATSHRAPDPIDLARMQRNADAAEGRAPGEHLARVLTWTLYGALIGLAIWFLL